MTSRILSAVLAGALLAPAPAAAQEPAPSSEGGANPYARLLLMPDLSAVASFAAVWNDDDVSFQFQELELGLKAAVDPYARADVYIAFSPEEVAVEEAFVTTTSLPGGFEARAGRIFSPFGRLNAQHPHTWDFADAPLARGRILAEEVLAGPGLELSWLAPLPWFAELRAAAQSTAPTEEDAERFTGVARLAQYVPVGDDTTLGVGLSAAVRDEGGGAWRELAGADLHVRWRPPAGRQAVTLQGELFGRRYTEGDGGEDWGGYAQLFWRRGAHGGIGVRYDQAPADGDSGYERRYGGVATWYLSEFQRLRLQVSHDVRPSGATGVEAFVQLEFGIGAHGAHPF